MSTLALLQSLKESLLSQASVRAIYGEPISVHGKTVIPVARIMYIYGAGAGTGGEGDTSARGEGGGGGGGVRAIPVGVIEISDQQTRFVPITDRKKLTGAILVGFGLGMWLGWRRRRTLERGLSYCWKLAARRTAGQAHRNPETASPATPRSRSA
jgi:uncharacterized spore protein YtfJ